MLGEIVQVLGDRLVLYEDLLEALAETRRKPTSLTEHSTVRLTSSWSY